MSTDAFEIYEVAGFGTGALALCRQPATDVEFSAVDAWSPDLVVTLTGEDEFPNEGIFLPTRFSEADYNWLHLPIIDFGTPPAADRDLWQDALEQLQDTLNTNGRILIHCKGGKGRSGMLLLRLLTLQGESGKTALARVREARAGAVETEDQYSWATKPL